jgi:hypothetical protein
VDAIGDDASDAAPDASIPDTAAPPVAVPDARSSGCYDGGYEIDAGEAGDTCAFLYECGFPDGISHEGCTVVLLLPDGGTSPNALSCWLLEGAGCEADAYSPGEGGSITIACNPCPAGGGRRTAGIVRGACARGPSALASYLAALAFEESASVAAFERLGDELRDAAAPASLLRASARAARDEVRHARAMTRQARRRGAEVEAPRVRARRARSLGAIAVENAAEGCVREAYGALLLRWQSLHAADAELRATFARIADDEERHAALAWGVARWLDERLDARAKARVRAAVDRALRTLPVHAEPEPSLARAAGLPSAAAARALRDGMARALGLCSPA